jgi:hypothetical protein
MSINLRFLEFPSTGLIFASFPVHVRAGRAGGMVSEAMVPFGTGGADGLFRLLTSDFQLAAKKAN